MQEDRINEHRVRQLLVQKEESHVGFSELCGYPMDHTLSLTVNHLQHHRYRRRFQEVYEALKSVAITRYMVSEMQRLSINS
jgi:hypothetical protein